MTRGSVADEKKVLWYDEFAKILNQATGFTSFIFILKISYNKF